MYPIPPTQNYRNRYLESKRCLCSRLSVRTRVRRARERADTHEREQTRARESRHARERADTHEREQTRTRESRHARERADTHEREQTRTRESRHARERADTHERELSSFFLAGLTSLARAGLGSIEYPLLSKRGRCRKGREGVESVLDYGPKTTAAMETMHL